MKNNRNLIIKVGVVIGAVVVAIVAVFLFNNQPKRTEQTKSTKMELTAAEESTIATLNLVIAKTELRTPQTAHIMYLDQLKDIAKRYNSATDWFDGSKATLKVKKAESQNQEIITLSDESYCAEFTLRKDSPSEYYLTKYSFERKPCEGKNVMFLTTEEIDKLPESMKE